MVIHSRYVATDVDQVYQRSRAQKSISVLVAVE